MYRVIRLFTCLCLCFLLLPITSIWAAEKPEGKSERYLERTEVQNFLRELAAEHQLDQHRLAGHFSDVTRQQHIIDAISTPAERTLTWGEYRGIFLKSKRIDQGRDFLAQHRALLERATDIYGVPASLITAIIGVETFYGRITGKHRVIEALATLAFDYPPRAKFFRSELTEFLVLSEKEAWDPKLIKGSYAGAMGLPQFISSSYREYAVDFDGDGKRDLHTSIADVIGSVANYLSVHGWRMGAPVASKWRSTSGKDVGHRSDISDLKRKSLKPQIALSTIKDLGYVPSLPDAFLDSERDERFVSVMPLEGLDGLETWVGYHNFYVITRYNHSQLYAMAVLQLSDAIGKSSP